MTVTPADHNQVFVSYSHQDREWLLKLQTMLVPLHQAGLIDLWDDTRIRPGAEWKAEIERALGLFRVV